MNPVYQQIHFLTSAFEARQFPPDEAREVVFAGRSNAGKSSAINALCQRKGLAQISKAPGRTRTINFFGVDSRQLVDLPGYGYAQAPIAIRKHWRLLVNRYLEGRRNLQGLILIMDIRHPLTDYDWQLLAWCQMRVLPVHILLNKADKLSRGGALTAAHKVKRLLKARGFEPGVQPFSALRRQGLEEAQAVLNGWLEL
jgi:GTP-binding protein